MASLSCTKEETNAPELETGEIEVTLTTGEITKTNYDGSAIGWLSTDKLGVMNESLDENHQFTQASYDGVRENTTFSGTVVATGTHYAYYPYSSTMKIGSGAVITVPNSQVLQSNDSFAANADLLVSEPINVGSISATIDGVRFRRLMSFIDFQFVDGSSAVDLSSEAIESLTVTAGVDLVGKVTLNPKTGELSAITDGSKSVYVGRVSSAIIGSSHNYAGIVPQTLAEGSELTLTVNTVHHKIQKTLTVPAGGIELKPGHIQPFRITITDEDFVPVVKREWKKTPMGLGSPWTDYLTVGKDYIKGNDRNMAMDDKFIYVAGASGSKKGVIAININDPSDIREVDMTGVSGGHFATSCVRTIWNPATSKWILLVGTLAFDNDFTFKVYAYLDGYNNAPTLVKSWATSSRRFGDTFTVVGDWSNGELWIRRNMDAGDLGGGQVTTIYFKITDGVIGDPFGAGVGYGASAGMGSCYKYSVDAKQFILETADIGIGYNYNEYSSWFENAGGVLWSGKDQTAMLRKFGITPFTYNGKNYIAYVFIGKKASETEKNGARGRLKIIEDLGGAANFMASIEADNVIYECPLQNTNDNASTVDEFDEVPYSANPSLASPVLGSCSVIPVGDDVYIAGHICNVGLSLFKMTR